MVAGAGGLGPVLLVDYGRVVSDGHNSQNPAAPGWWKSWSGWSQRVNESDWLILFIVLGIATTLLLGFGWEHWLLAVAFLLMGSVRLLPRWLYWSLGVLLLIIASVVLF